MNISQIELPPPGNFLQKISSGRIFLTGRKFLPAGRYHFRLFDARAHHKEALFRKYSKNSYFRREKCNFALDVL
jgi:hypothetical protein